MILYREKLFNNKFWKDVYVPDLGWKWHKNCSAYDGSWLKKTDFKYHSGSSITKEYEKVSLKDLDPDFLDCLSTIEIARLKLVEDV